MRTVNLWTPEEEALACQLRREGYQVKDIAKRLGRPRDSVAHKLCRLNAGIVTSKYSRWTKVSRRRLKRLWPTASWQELERAFPGYTRKSISNQAWALKVRRIGFRDALEERHRIEMLNEAEAAYVAGIIDGEGSIMFSRGYLLMSVGNTSEALIRWLENKIGGRSYFYPTSGGMGTKPFWRWHLTKGRACQALIFRIRPYLIIKADVADTKVGAET